MSRSPDRAILGLKRSIPLNVFKLQMQIEDFFFTICTKSQFLCHKISTPFFDTLQVQVTEQTRINKQARNIFKTYRRADGNKRAVRKDSFSEQSGE